MIKKVGITRTVYLIGRYAIKFPSCENYLSFLKGLYCNQSEFNWYKSLGGTKYHNLLAPVRFNLSGFILVMDRCKEIYKFPPIYVELRDTFYEITTDLKLENFGLLNNKLVLVDYA